MADNFKLLKIPWIFENNIRNVIRYLLELDFDYTTWLQLAKLNTGSFDSNLRPVYSLWRRRVQAQKPRATRTLIFQNYKQEPPNVNHDVMDLSIGFGVRPDLDSGFNKYYIWDLEQTEV